MIIRGNKKLSQESAAAFLGMFTNTAEENEYLVQAVFSLCYGNCIVSRQRLRPD